MEFVRYFIELRLFLDQVDDIKSGVAISHFGPTHIKRMFIVFPPAEEQAIIAAHLNRETEGIRKSQATLHNQITLIREYRTRLVNDVITGKLDVRGVELPATERPEESEHLETDAVPDVEAEEDEMAAAEEGDDA